jgi:hypothetical protein
MGSLQIPFRHIILGAVQTCPHSPQLFGSTLSHTSQPLVRSLSQSS